MDELRSVVLNLVDTHAELHDRPELLERVRSYIFSTSITEENVESIAIDALREAGIMATFRHTESGPKLEVIGTHVSFMTDESSLPPIRGRRSHHKSKARFRDVWPYVWRIVDLERRELIYVTVYAAVSSLLGLVVPLSSQAIVNAVALGVFSQQLVVLCIVVLIAMLILAGFAVLERYIVDLIQRRLFVRSSFDIIYRLPYIQRKALRSTYAPELVNRFFDVMTIQKSIGKFILDGINGFLVLATGLILLGFYHPIFLVYDLVFLLFVPVLVFVLGRGALKSAIDVSKRKYEAAAWIEDVARTQLAFKMTDCAPYAFDRIDDISGRYVDAKHRHFVVIARQILGSYIFKAFATVGILAVGGGLVIEQQISLGQLVAAEIVIILIIGALEKLIGQFDAYYELIAAVDKLSAIAEQPLETIGGDRIPYDRPTQVELKDVALGYDGSTVIDGLNLHIASGSRIALVGRSGSGKSTSLLGISGVYETMRGTIRVNGRDLRELDVRDYRRHVGYVFPEDQLVEGSIKENILLGRDLPSANVQWAVAMTNLTDDIAALADGLNTMLPSGGETISFGMRRRILFARMIVHKPSLLLIDEAFDGIEDGMKLDILRKLFEHDEWTIIGVSHDPEIIQRSEIVHVIQDGRVVESGSPQELAQRRAEVFCSLFPIEAENANGEGAHHE